MRLCLLGFCLSLLVACGDDSDVLDGGLLDASSLDGGLSDTGPLDAGSLDAGSLDAGSLDAGSLDAGAPLECEGVRPIGDVDGPAAFVIRDGRAVMTGIIGRRTPARVAELLEDNPEVRIVVMPDVLGSDDDVANLRASRMVHAAALATCVPSDGQIASGGVDFFLAGTRRSAVDGAQLGVHSWADGSGTQGGDIPRDDPEHRLYLDYYDEVGVDADFYWFTLEAARSDDIHWMTRTEIERWDMESR